MALTEEQKAKNSEADSCGRASVGKWVSCDHKYCWDPDECTEQEYETTNECGMKVVHAKLDKCSCGKEYHYP